MSDWIKGAIKKPGAFRAKAETAGMSTLAYARHVLREGSKADDRTKRQARLFLTLRKLAKRRRNRTVDFGACLEGREGTMNTLILNRDFRLPEDGWYQVVPLGEFAHSQSGVVQVVDRAACEAMAAAFRNEAGIDPADSVRADGFPGVLVDFDHFSLDSGQRSEAAGWLTNLECRDSGLWGQIRWSDAGEEAVKGGRYRFISPVWAKTDCEDLGPDPQSGRDRVRPVRLLNAAVTNDPNLKGMVPLSNRGQRGEGFEQKVAKEAKGEGAAEIVAEAKAALRNRVVDFRTSGGASGGGGRGGRDETESGMSKTQSGGKDEKAAAPAEKDMEALATNAWLSCVESCVGTSETSRLSHTVAGSAVLAGAASKTFPAKPLYALTRFHVPEARKVKRPPGLLGRLELYH